MPGGNSSSDVELPDHQQELSGRWVTLEGFSNIARQERGSNWEEKTELMVRLDDLKDFL